MFPRGRETIYEMLAGSGMLCAQSGGFPKPLKRQGATRPLEPVIYSREIPNPRDRLCLVVALTALAVAVVVCFLPLMGYFFSQDDFILMHRASHESGEMIKTTFGPYPHHFRPLTKIFYFASMYRIFGLHPLPYHLMSLLMHLVNVFLVFLLLRKLRLSVPAAYVASGLFALNVAFFHVIGWISCVQQLAATLFMLLSIWFAIVALEDGRMKSRMLSMFSYLLAIHCLEQTFLTPVMIALMALLGLSGRYKLKRIAGTLWPQFLIMIMYAAMRIWWKGTPDVGISKFEYGSNILVNLVMYMGALYEFWPKVGDLIPRVRYTITNSLYLLVIVCLYNIARWRPMQVFWGLCFVLAALLPALPLKGHTFYYHTYAAGFGAVFIIGMAIDDLFRLLRFVRLRTVCRQLIVAGVLVAVVAGFSWKKVRWNEWRVLNEKTSRYGSFVLRRAIIAGRTWTDIKAKRGDLTGVTHIYIGRGSPEDGLRVAEPRDLFWAYGNGIAFNVFFDGYEVSIERTRLIEQFAKQQTEQSRVFFYDKKGNLFTYDEVLGEEPTTDP